MKLKIRKMSLKKLQKKRIKVGLILNEFGEQNKIKVEEHEIQTEVQKQIRDDAGSRKNGNGILSKKPIGFI